MYSLSGSPEMTWFINRMDQGKPIPQTTHYPDCVKQARVQLVPIAQQDGKEEQVEYVPNQGQNSGCVSSWFDWTQHRQTKPELSVGALSPPQSADEAKTLLPAVSVTEPYEELSGIWRIAGVLD